MKILITGGSGLLGSNILYSFQRKSYQLYYTVNDHIVSFDGICIKADLVKNFHTIERYSYDVIINTIALTDVDTCEKNPELSYRLNTEIPEKLAKYCFKTNTHLVHISTDQVFDGKEGSYTEEYEPHPINVYAKTKYEAEKRIRSILPQEKYTILRTNFFGINCIHKFSFSEWILDCLRNKKEIKMFYDVYFNPLLVNTLVEIIDRCIRNNVSGIYNCTSDRPISKYDFGTMVKNIFHLNHPIQRISIKEMQFAAKRPENMYLINTKIKQTLQIKNLSVKGEVVKLYSLYQDKYPEKLKSHYVPQTQ